jgi:formylglycine-generating enzyme required for sulfatase activity/dienelactone hydrolase
MTRHLNYRLLWLFLPAVACAQSNSPLMQQNAAGKSASDSIRVAAVAAAIAADMASIPAGTFQMGDLQGKGFTFERPVHQVTVPGFKLAKHDITFEQYDLFARLTGRPLPEQRPGVPRGSSPAANVSWADAQAFIAWVNSSGHHYRLPSEAEWEYAARAGSKTLYPWGDTFDASKANAVGKKGADKWEAAAPVGSFPPNAFGLYDMVGNVWQWMQDCQHLNYQGAPTDGSAWMSGGNCGWHLTRGGSWVQDPTGMRVSLRIWDDTGRKYQTLGFRLAEGGNAPALAEAAGVARPDRTERPQPQGPVNNYERQQRSQAFATAKLAKSPRKNEWVTFPFQGRTLKGWVDYPQVQGKVPVILVLHEVFGLTDSTRNTADEVAAMGYIAITPDMVAGFGPNGGGTESFTTRSASEALDLREDAEVYKDLEAWMDFGNRLPQANGKVGIVGLTWGGGLAFRYAVSKPRKDLKAVYVFTGAGPPVYNQGPAHFNKIINDSVVHKTTVPVYGFYGEMDLTTPTPVVLSVEDSKRAMAAVGNFYEPVIYEGAEHAYMRFGEDPANENSANAAGDKASLVRLEKLLKENFK